MSKWIVLLLKGLLVSIIGAPLSVMLIVALGIPHNTLWSFLFSFGIGSLFYWSPPVQKWMWRDF